MAAVPINLEALPDDVNIGNDEKIEQDWAERAFKFAEQFEMLLKIFNTTEKLKKFKFSPEDDYIYEKFRREWPELDCKHIDVDQLKAKSNKMKWFNFLEQFKTTIPDYNQGTLLRINPREPIGPQNSVLVPRVQFYMIELARCREGGNEEFCGIE